MAKHTLRHPENVDGDLFVDTTCIDCDLCRQIAPAVFGRAGDQSAVHQQPRTPDQVHEALKALITCPTASIGTSERHSFRNAIASYPDRVEQNVYFCGFAAESSFGASSYLVVRPEGNVLVDSPRFATPLVRQIEALGGVAFLFLTHQDDVADHKKWALHFGAQRILHEQDLGPETQEVERKLAGTKPVQLDPTLLAIPTPGHTRGHTVLLYADRYLFTGDHVWWSDVRGRLSASRDVCWYSWSEQTRSMQHLLQYTFEWILPGHGRRFHASPNEMRQHLEVCLHHMQS